MSEQTESLPREKMESLGDYARTARLLAGKIESLELELKQANDMLKDVLEIKMPEILMEIGIEQIRLTTGEKLTLSTYYSASLSDERPELKEQAFNWLRTNGHDSIIKNEVKGTFGKGEEGRAAEVMTILEKHAPGLFTRKSLVHPMTLKSFVKELCEAGTPPPAEPFRLYIGKKVTIK